MTPRRQFILPLEDEKFLDEYGLPWETVIDGSPWLLVHNWPTPKGYNEPKVTAAIRIETGYPDVGLDMVYVYPHLKRIDGRPIGWPTPSRCLRASLISAGHATARLRIHGRPAPTTSEAISS